MSKSKRELNMTVFTAGYATAGATLAALYFLNRTDFNPMGLYVLFIVPAGALLTGMAAGSGYGLGSYWSNVRVGMKSIYFILGLGVLTFFLAHYATYRGILAENHIPEENASFWRYFRYLCENMTYNIDAHHHPNAKGIELGSFGYFFKLIECLGFAAGGVIPLTILQKKPYCDACRRYLKPRLKAEIVSDELQASLKKKKKPEKTAAIEAAAAKLLETAAPLFAALPKSEYAQNLAALQALPAASAKGRLGRIAMELRKCPECDNHAVIAMLHLIGLNGQMGSQELGRIDVTVNRAEEKTET